MRAGSVDADNARLLRGTRGRRGGNILVICAVALAAIVGFAGWMMMSQESGSIPGFAQADGAPMLRVAGRSPNLIDGITIETRGRNIELVRDGAGWRLASASGYPVPEGRVEPVIQALGALRAAYVSTRSPPPYQVFGLGDVNEPTSQSAKISVRDDGGENLGTLTVGGVVSAPGALNRDVTALMRPDDSRIWLADGKLDIEQNPLQWLNNHILSVARDDVRRLTTTAPNGHRLVLVAGGGNGGNALRIAEGVPNGVSATQTWMLDEMVNLFRDMRFFDVRRREGFRAAPEATWQVALETDRGVIYHMSLLNNDAGPWVIVRAEAENGAGEQTRTRAAQFNARHRPWTYKISEPAAKYLTTSPEDLAGDRREPAGGR